MRSISNDNATALAARQLVARDFLWVVARSLTTGAAFPYGFWSDVGNISAAVVNPDTGVAVTRNFEGSGTLIQISDIPSVANMEVQTISISMSQLDPAVENIIRGYDMKQAKVEVYRGMFSPTSRQLVSPAYNLFTGYVDNVTITTPKENDVGGIELSCVSSSQEFTRFNPDTRSHDSQLLRSSTDAFFKDTTTCSEWEHFWGTAKGKVATTGPQRIELSVGGER